jgi:hypothetical protein
MISAASIMINAVAAYMARTLGTPRRLSSFQNPGLLFDIYAGDGFSARYNLKAKKSNEPCSAAPIFILLAMTASQFKHLRKEKLKKRVKLFSVFIYVGFAIALASFIVFFTTDYKFNWSWLLIGLTYVLWPINLIQQKRRMIQEIEFREDRSKKRQQ